MDFNESKIDADASQFYKLKQKNSNQASNISSYTTSQQQQLYQQQMQQAHYQQSQMKNQAQQQVFYQNTSNTNTIQSFPSTTINQTNPQVVNKHVQSLPLKKTPDLQKQSSGYNSVSNTNTGCGTSLKAKDLLSLLRHGIALLPGGRDKRGGPILCFPANSRADELDIEDLYVLVRYLTFLPDENVKKLKFSVVIDMRAGTTWHSVKPILKVLEECIGACTAVVYIIKPDKFLEKHKTQMASNKFMFDIQMVSLNSLYLEVDQSQLTIDFEGVLSYNNEEWIQIRICLEEFFTMAHEMSDKFSSLFKFLDRKDSPLNVIESKHRLEDHKNLRHRIIKAPVHVLEAEGEKLGHWLRYGKQTQPSNNMSWVTMNPDYQQLIPQVKKTVQQLYDYRAHLQNKWETGRRRLEQIYQLRLFEDDIGRMSDWLNQQRNSFLTEYLDIGQSASQAADLYAEHRQFLIHCADVREQVSRLTGVATMLSESGHFARQQIQGQARKLDHNWKSFTNALEDRSNVLQLSASFHARAEAFLANCPHWETAMKQQQLQAGQPETVISLSQYISTLQQLWEEAQMAHEEVCSDGRALAGHLIGDVPIGSHTSLAAAVDYTDGKRHCTHLMHELWACFKRVETVHANRKKRLTARLSLLMFREDVAQVLAWLNEHGEPFLKRQTSVGKTFQRAEQLYNGHMQFEEVAANTLTNAEKLIAAADDLVSQAHDPEEILQEETILERRIKAFTKAVEIRRNTLDLAVGFHGHTKDLFKLFHQLKESYNAVEMLPLTIEAVEIELRRFHCEKRSILDAAEKVLKEGIALCSRLIEDDEKIQFKVLLSQVSNDKAIANDLLTERQVRLDLCLQLRLFEADVASAMGCLKQEVPTPFTCYFLHDPTLARSMNELEEVTSSFMAALKTGEEVSKKGLELASAFEKVGVNFPAGGLGSNDSGVVDSAEYAVERIQRLGFDLSDLVFTVDEVNIKLKIELDGRRLDQQSQQVLTWIAQCDDMLRQTAMVPGNLIEAEQLQKDHDKFQPILSEAHPQAVTCARFAEIYIQQINYNIGSDNDSSLGSMDAGNQTPNILSRKKAAQNIAELVADQWQKLVYAAEEKHKLLMAAGNWYKTSEQVTSVLRSLEKEYCRAEDWCQNERALSRGDQVEYLGDLLSRHFDQKEAFLKACILARRTSEQFIKYLGRQPVKTPGRASVQEKVDSAIKDLMVKEQAVLLTWAARKSRLDECLDFIRIKGDAEELILHFDEAGVTSQKLDDAYKRILQTLESKNLSQHSEVIKMITTRLNSRFANQLLLKSSQLASIQSTMVGPQSVVASQPSRLRAQLSTGSSGYSSGDLNRTGSGTNSITSTTTSGSVSGLSMSSTSSQVQEKAAKYRINLIKEMIQTENAYVNDLSVFINTYYKAVVDGDSELKIPTDLAMRKDVIFSNIKEIHEFHKNHFLPEVQKYQPIDVDATKSGESACLLPEDIGHCFIRFSNELKKIYVKYCSNKDEANQIMMSNMDFFNELMVKYFSGEDQMKSTMQSFWIKPVQRITKYTLFLKDLSNNCDSGCAGELSEAWEVMLEVNKRINDEIHLKDIRGLPEERSLESLGDFLLMNDFTVWEPRQIIKKGRERRVFLFDACLVLTKKFSSDDGKILYQCKSLILLTECNITEHIEGDQCKFALWTGRVPPLGEYRLVLKAKDLEIKQKWVRSLRETMQQRIFSFGPVFEESQRGRMTSSTSEVGRSAGALFYVMESFTACESCQLTVERAQRVQLIEVHGDWALVDTVSATGQPELDRGHGLVPAALLISVATRHCLVDDKSVNRSALKRWLRDRHHGPVRRGSKADSQPIPTPLIPVIPPEADATLHDSLSEDSVDVELPPPMALQEFPAPDTAGSSTVTQDSRSVSDQDEAASVTCGTPVQTEDQASAQQNEDQRQFSLVMRDSSSRPVLEQDELGIALEKNLRLSRHARQENERYQTWQQFLVSEQHCGATDPLSSKEDMCQSYCSTAFLGPQFEHSDDNGHYLVPPHILDLPGNGDQRLLGRLCLSEDMYLSSRLWAPQHDQVGDDATYDFKGRRLLLFEHGFMLITEQVPEPPLADADTSSSLCPTVVRCKHALNLSRLTIEEHVATSQLWFCLYEDVGANQNMLCHTVDPICLDTRARWLRELSHMIQSVKSDLPDNQTASLWSNTIAENNTGSHQNSKTPSLFQLESEPLEIDFVTKSGKISKSSSKIANKSNMATTEKEGRRRLSADGSKRSH